MPRKRCGLGLTGCPGATGAGTGADGDGDDDDDDDVMAPAPTPAAGLSSPPPPPVSNEVAPADPVALLARVRVERRDDGGLRLEALPDAADTLAALFDGMARLLRDQSS